MESGLTGIIFDLDGTLIDSALDLHAAALKLLEEERLPALPLESVRSFVGNGVPKLVERLIHASGREDSDEAALSELSARFLCHYEASPSERTRPYSGVYEALASLRSKGFPLAVCTNKPEKISRIILKDLKMGAFFSTVVGGDTCAVKKPDPAPVRHALQKLGRDKAFYVGDSETDAETALRAKLPFFLFSEGYRKTSLEQIPHNYAFAEFSLLPELVDAALGEFF